MNDRHNHGPGMPGPHLRRAIQPVAVSALPQLRGVRNMRLHTYGTYPPDWADIARRTKDEAGNRCIRCRHPHDPEAGRTLTVHHLNGNKSDCRWHNLLALCQACHLSIQARVNPDQAWVMTEHTPWFRIYVAGLYASKYLGVELTREECEARLDELLGLERAIVLGVTV